VTSSADSLTQKGTLRYAIAHAASGDTILLAASLRNTPIMLSQGELLVDKDLTIQAKKNAPVTVNAGGNSRVFDVASNAHVTLANLTIAGGNQAVNVPNAFYAEGGGILNLGTLTMDHSTLSGNSADYKGGGIFNIGTVAISDSTLAGNSAGVYGGGILNLGKATISHSILSENSAYPINFNSAYSKGGAIYNDRGGTLTLGDSTLSDNSALSNGGGIFNFYSTLTINSSVLSNNHTDFEGGGISSSAGL
jgi:hypothetical protein